MGEGGLGRIGANSLFYSPPSRPSPLRHHQDSSDGYVDCRRTAHLRHDHQLWDVLPGGARVLSLMT